MKIQFFGAARMVTGSCTLLESGSVSMLIDCGMIQGDEKEEIRNALPFPFDVKAISAVMLTHAHLDHVGLVPKLYKEGYRNPVHATRLTRELCEILLEDSAAIAERETAIENRHRLDAGLEPVSPIYTMEEAKACLSLFQDHSLLKPWFLSEDVRVQWFDAGHILGSAMVEVVLREAGEEHTVVFSGDIGHRGKPFLPDPSKLAKADVLVMESTYGDRLHPGYEEAREQLAKIVCEAYERGGPLMIPCFAIQRTQEMLYYLHCLEEEGRIPSMDIFLDSPMAHRVTQIFNDNIQFIDQKTKEMESGNAWVAIGKNHRIHSLFTKKESQALNQKGHHAIIISSGGMAQGGRILHHLKHHLWQKESTVLFVGYQAEGTLGRELLSGQKQVEILGKRIHVEAAIEQIEGFSAHADQPELLDWLGAFEQRPAVVFLQHGEMQSILALQARIQEKYGIKTWIPHVGQTYFWPETK